MSRSAVVLLGLLLVAGFGWAQEPASPATAAGQLSFADALQAGGDGFRAATEYLRLLHFFPESPEAEPALRGLARAYAQAGRWDEAAGVLTQWEARRPGPEARLLLGAVLYSGGHYARATNVLLSPGAGEEATVLATLAALRAGRLENLPAGVRLELADEYGRLPRKTPAVAGTLATLLPGAGHLYCDRPRDALVSFLLNAAFLVGTVEAARSHQWAVAGVVGAFEVGWYTGNVVSALNAAHKWNRREEARFFQRYEAGALPSLTLAPRAGGGKLELAWAW